MPTILFMRSLRPILLALGLLTISAGAVLVIAAAQTTILVADHNLSQYWRTSYDILVRPADARSPIEEKYGLVEANHLSGLWGGITFEQYEAIKAIPGVEVAAPIAMLARVLGDITVMGEGLHVPKEPGVYIIEQIADIDEGVRIRNMRMTDYIFVGPEPSPDMFALASTQGIFVNPLDVTTGSQPLELLFAAIDPEQEASLVRLNQAVVEGEYLKENEPLRVTTYNDPLSGSKPFVHDVPVLINATPYISYTQHNRVARVLVPPEISALDTIMEHGGIPYLDTFATETISEEVIAVEALYPVLIKRFREGEQPESNIPLVWQAMRIGSTPVNRVYRQITPPFPYNDLVLEAALPSSNTLAVFPSIFTVKAQGVFDIEFISRPADVNRVPLETYFPPEVTLRYDESGRLIEPKSLRPSPYPDYYLQPPPMILTTLEAARALRGEEAISAIRVRVALNGCPPEQPETCILTPANQRKIEAIAIEIQRRTGLNVDIMVGSSPTPVLVHIPEIGYVEEQWIQKGVNLVYKQGIQTGNWLLMMTLLAAAGLFTLDMTWAEVVSRRHLIALQKALGWRSRTVFGQILGQVLSLGLAATLVGTVGALGVIQFLNLQPPPDWLVPGLPLVVLGISTLGSLLPAWLASRTPPMVDLRQGGLRYRRTGRRMALGMWGYAWNGLLRRAGRTLLAGLTAVLSAGLLVLLVAVLLEQRGMLGGTLLGEFILVRVQGFHYAIVGIGFGLAAFSTANSLLAGVLERRREIGALKAMGWRTGAVMGLFVLEGALLGLGGGTMGALLGSLTFVYLYHTIVPGLILAMLVGMSVPGLVGALAALYPARVAARVPPAESVRYE